MGRVQTIVLSAFVATTLVAGIGLPQTAEAASVHKEWTTWSTKGPGSIGVFGDEHSAGSKSFEFENNYVFSVSGSTGLESVVQNLNVGSRDIEDLRLSLYADGPGASDTLLARSDKGNGSTLEILGLSYAALQPGMDYILRVTGLIGRYDTGSFLGGYRFTEVSPVPLPSAAMLFGSALLGLIGVGRQKRAARDGAEA